MLFFVGLPFALAGVAAHMVAAVWPLRDNPDRRWPRLWTSTMIARAVLGLAVGGLGMVSGLAYGTNHQLWFGGLGAITTVVVLNLFWTAVRPSNRS